MTHIKHITLIRPSLVSSIRSYSTAVTPPIALAYLSSSLKKENFQVAIIDGLGEAIEQITVYPEEHYRIRGLTNDQIVSLIPFETQLIGISCMFSIEWPHLKKLINKIRDQMPQCPIVLGGEHATALPEFILQTTTAVDICVLGEGEETMVELAKSYPHRLSDIQGISYRKGKEIVFTPRRARKRDLALIPLPDWESLPLENYLNSGYSWSIFSGRSIPILATRGCPYQCTFCSSEKMWTTTYTTRPPEDVVDEIESYVMKYRINHVDFCDLTAIIHKNWIMRFGKLLQERKLGITWSLPSGTRSEALDEEVLILLKATGCNFLCYAPESGSPRTLKLIKKKISLQKMLQSISTAKKVGFTVKCNLIIGFPFEHRKDVWRTLFFQFHLALAGADDAPLFLFSPYPGTELYNQLTKEKAIQEINDDYFRSLMCFMDLTISTTYCKHIGPRELGFYRLLGMGIFYLLSFIRHPKRIFHMIQSIVKMKGSGSILEQRIIEFIKSSFGKKYGEIR